MSTNRRSGSAGKSAKTSLSEQSITDLLRSMQETGGSKQRLGIRPTYMLIPGVVLSALMTEHNGTKTEILDMCRKIIKSSCGQTERRRSSGSEKRSGNRSRSR